MRVGLGVVLAGAVLALPAGASAADFPPPIDKQVVQDQDDMTWADYKAVPGTNWADPSLVPSVRKLKIAVVAVDFTDQPFVITQPKGSDPFGNPQIDGIPRAQVPKFYADFNGIPSALNNGHTVNEYWMEQTHGRIGMSFTPYGPYLMPRPLYEYGLNEFDQQAAAPPGTPATATWIATSTRSGRADEGANIRSQFDLVLRVYAGYDETTIWQEFGEMKFETKEEVPDEWGPPDPLLPNWVTNRYVPWTSWRAGAQQWGLSSIRQGESSGTITHEIVHTFGLPDNNNNPYVTPYHRVGSGPWDILDRGSFNGPGGPHKRWLVPVTQGGAMEAGMTLWTKPEEQLAQGSRRPPRHPQRPGRLRRADDARQGAHGRARHRRHADGHQARPRRPGAGRQDAGLRHQHQPALRGHRLVVLHARDRAADRRGLDDARQRRPDPEEQEQLEQRLRLRVLRRGSIDAHPEDMNKVDFLRPRTKTPRDAHDRRLPPAQRRAVPRGHELGLAVRVRGHAPTGCTSTCSTSQRDAAGVQSYDVAIRNLDGAGPHTRGVHRRRADGGAEPGRREHLHVHGQQHRRDGGGHGAGRRRWTTRRRTSPRTSTACRRPAPTASRCT